MRSLRMRSLRADSRAAAHILFEKEPVARGGRRCAREYEQGLSESMDELRRRNPAEMPQWGISMPQWRSSSNRLEHRALCSGWSGCIVHLHAGTIFMIRARLV
jgi:hypothetical protein